jgi:ADP-ribose pyrophosphatase
MGGVYLRPFFLFKKLFRYNEKMSKTPWPKLREELAYDGYQMVKKKTFQCPDGSEFTYDIVGSYHTVCTVAVTTDNQFLLVEQFRPGPEEYILELPAGRLDAGEEPMAAAARELLEETGYQGDMELLHESFFSAYSPRKRFNFLARNCKKIAEPHQEAGEFVTLKILNQEEFFDHIVNGGSTDVEGGYAALYRLGLLQKSS